MILQNFIIIKNLDVSKFVSANMMISNEQYMDNIKHLSTVPGCWFVAFMKVTACTCGTDFCTFRSDENFTILKSLYT